VFERYELQAESAKASYADVASSLGISVTDVTNYLLSRDASCDASSSPRSRADRERRGVPRGAKALLGIDV
jgi:hypothetical protein